MEMEGIKEQLTQAVTDYFQQVNLRPGSLFVLGCSTSAVAGKWMGTDSSQEIGNQIVQTLRSLLQKYQVDLAVQGCQHINRALLMERKVAAAHHYEEVTVIPQLHAGGAAQVAAYQQFQDPVEVEHIIAEGGMDIGDTQIGMHVKFVQIPILTSQQQIGQAHVTFLASRPKLIGGSRAAYPDSKL